MSNFLYSGIEYLTLQLGDSLRSGSAMLAFLLRALKGIGQKPYRFGLWLQQAEFIGFGSLFIVILTGVFTGAVFTLQLAQAMAKVNMTSMVGSSVLLAVSRELAPVLSALMVTGRVGSAMATELGTMRVSEQIDAMEVMAVDPVQYLVTPRIVASSLMMPCLCMLFTAVATIGAYVTGVIFLGIDEGAFWARIERYLTPADFVQGLIKAWVFGLLIALVGCYKGFHAEGGARGVGRATTQTVVMGSVMIFILDYVMTSILLTILPS